MNKRVTIKIPSLFIIIVALFFVAIILKLSYIVLSDTVDGVNLKQKATAITKVTKTLYANRGSIYDINGIKLASSVNSYTVIAYLSKSRTTDPENPRHVVDKEHTAEVLSGIINMSKERILELLNREAYQVELGPGGRNITDVTKALIEKEELPGIDFITNSKKRFYNKSTFASYIIGYAKENSDGILTGEMGIESAFNSELSGENGKTTYVKYTSSNYRIPGTDEETIPAKDGNDVYLTIDSKVQLIAEKAVSKFKDNLNASWSAFTVMDAKTGAIVASATSPNFDPNDTNTITDYLNPLVSKEYEPGSVMKIFSFATAIEEGKYKGDEVYKSGSIEVADAVIRDSERDGWGKITFDKGFAYSSNVAATILALRLGKGILSDYYSKLGFGTTTDIELANEASGKLKITYQTELANASFGQGISVTAIQMLQALSILSNDGTVIKPYIVDKIVDSDGNIIYKGKREEVAKVYSKSTIDKMHQLAYDVIYNGLSKSWQPHNVTIMGKTGTAQIAGKGGYLKDQYTKSFAGVFPYDNPKYIVYAVASHLPIDVRPFANVVTTAIEEIASYASLNENATDMDEAKTFVVDNYISKKVETVKSNLTGTKIVPIILGSGDYIIDQYPIKNNTVLSNGKLFLKTNKNDYKMPNIKGWSLNEVRTLCNLLDIELEYSGFGYVIESSIAENADLSEVNKLTIKLAKEY